MPRGVLRTMQPFEISHSCVTRSLWNVFKYMVNGLLRWIYVYNKLCRGYSFLFLNASELSQGKPVIQDIFLVWFFVVGTICLQRDETSWNSQNTRCFHEAFLFAHLKNRLKGNFSVWGDKTSLRIPKCHYMTNYLVLRTRKFKEYLFVVVVIDGSI